jgi:predicted nuclease of predicted toxin-antitoxin system
MSRILRFHLDENCPTAIALGMRRRGIDVTTTAEAGLISATDEEQTAYALTEGRGVFTQDQDFLRINAAGVPHAGIVYCRQHKRSIGEIISGLAQIWELMEPEQMRDRLVYL